MDSSQSIAGAVLTPAVIYGSKSTVDLKASIPDQIAACREFAAVAGWDVVAVEQDENASGYSGNRGPGLQRALDQAEALAAEHGGAVLLVWHSNRLGRGGAASADDARHLGELYFWASRRHIALHSVQDDALLSHPAFAAMAGELAHMESQTKAANVKAGMARRRQRGLLNGPAPYGYTFQRNPDGTVTRDAPLQPVEAEAVIVRRVFTAYAGGQSQRQIVRELNREGVKTRRGKEWIQGALQVMLSNRTYAGYVHGTDELGRHKPLISEDLWQRTEAIRIAHTRTRGKGRGRPSKARHLLQGGLLKCGRCGGTMEARTSVRIHNHRYEYAVYICSTRRADPERCDQPAVRREDLDSTLLEYFIDTPATVAAVQRDAAALREAELKAARAGLTASVKAVRFQEARLERVRQDYTLGELTAAEWRGFRDELTADVTAARAEADRLHDEEQALAAAVAAGDLDDDLAQRLAAIRGAILAPMGDGARAGNLEAVRAALKTIYVHFTIASGPLPLEVTDGTPLSEIIDAGVSADNEFILLPQYQDGVLQADGTVGRTISLPAPTSTSTAANNDAGGLTR